MLPKRTLSAFLYEIHLLSAIPGRVLIPEAVAHRLIVAAIWYYLCQMFASPLSA
jgi:hypothetical protein